MVAFGRRPWRRLCAHWFLLPNLQIDVHAAVGLNEAAADFFGGSGLSWRW